MTKQRKTESAGIEQVDYFFMRHQRRLREKFGIEACEKRGEKIGAALYARREKIREGGILWKVCAAISRAEAK